MGHTNFWLSFEKLKFKHASFAQAYSGKEHIYGDLVCIHYTLDFRCRRSFPVFSYFCPPSI